MRFSNGEEMRRALEVGDLYCERTGEYVFKYTEEGAICIYDVSLSDAYKLEKMAREDGSYWGAFLGAGGCVYDDEAELEWKFEEMALGEWEFTSSLFVFKEDK